MSALLQTTDLRPRAGRRQGPAAAGARPASPRRKPGVLVVEGDRLLRCLLSVALQRAGFRVFLATTGSEAVATYRVRRGEIDVVLLEASLTSRRGLATAAWLRLTNPRVRICFLTDDPAAAEPEFLAEGAVGVVFKGNATASAAGALARMADASPAAAVASA